MATGKAWLSLDVRASKNGAYEEAGTEVSTMDKVTDPLLLIKDLKATGSWELASLKTEAAMSGRRIRIRASSGWRA